MNNFFKNTCLIIVISLFNSPSILWSQWLVKPLTPTSNLFAVDYSTSSDVWIAGQNGLFTSTTGGNTFNYILPQDINNVQLLGSTFYDIHAFSSNTAVGTGFIYTGNNEIILKTINSGINWSFPYMTTGFIAELYDIDFPDATTGYCVGFDGHIFKSANAGNSWTQQTSNTTNDLYAVKFFNANSGIAVGDGVILTTSNGGSSWSVNTVPAILRSIDIVGTNMAIAGGDTMNASNAVLMKTTNAGASWVNIPTNFSDVADLRIFDSDTIILASQTNFYRSTDGGDYWDEYIVPQTNKHFRKIDFLDSQNGFAVGNNSYCIYTHNGGTLKPYIIASSSETNSYTCIGNTINFTNTSNPAYTYSWYYDGAFVNSNYNFSYAFNTAGNHTVKVIASNGTATDSVLFTYNVQPLINVISPQIAPLIDSLCPNGSTSFEIYNTIPGQSYQLRKGYQFIAGGSGNGGTLTLATGVITTTTVFNVKTVQSNLCFTDSAIVIDSVVVPLPDKTLQIIPDRPYYCVGDPVTILIINSQPWVKYSFSSFFTTYWQGNGDTLFIPYSAGSGLFNLTVYAKSDFGCTVVMNNHAIFTIQYLTMGFQASSYGIVVGDTVTFTNQSNGTYFSWTFGNGASISSFNDTIPPPIIYSTVGTSTVQLIASNAGGCVDTISKTITVFNPVSPTVLDKCLSGFINGKYFINDFYVDVKGNSYVTGHFYLNYAGNFYHYFVAKLDSAQNLIWYKEEPGSFNVKGSYGTGVVADSAGNTYVCGNFNGTNMQFGGFTFTDTQNDTKLFIVKYDTAGTEQWLIKGKLSGTYGIFASDIGIDSLQNVYISGEALTGFTLTFPNSSTHNGISGAFILAVDTGGLMLDIATYYGPSYGIDLRSASNGTVSSQYMYAVAPKIKVLSNGRVGIAGTAGGSVMEFDSISIPLTNDGIYYAEYQLQNGWTKAFKIAEASTAYELQGMDVDMNGNVYVTGKITGGITYNGTTIPISGASYLIKTDAAGNGQYLTYTPFGFFHDVDVKSNGHIVLMAELYKTGGFKDAAGYSFAINSNGNNDYAIIEYDEFGNYQWAQQYGSDSVDYPYYQQLNSCDDLYICSNVNSVNALWPYAGTCIAPCSQIGAVEISKIALDGYCNKANCVPVNEFANEAGITKIESSSKVLSAGINPVFVQIKNYGSNTLSNVSIDWQVDGINQPTYIWSGSLLTNVESTNFSIGNYNFNNGYHTIKAWTKNPNGVIDSFPVNDTLQIEIYVCNGALAGAYTAGAAADFHSIHDAIDALDYCGINSSVTISILPVNSTRKIYISKIPGANANDTIVFQSANSDSTSVVFNYTSNDPVNNAVITLDTAEYITFKSVTLFNHSLAPTSYDVFLNNHANHNRITNCAIKGIPVVNNSYNQMLIGSSTLAENNNRYENNIFTNGTDGINLIGTFQTNDYEDSTVISNNIFINQYHAGIYTHSAGFSVIDKNYITSNSTLNYWSGIWLKENEFGPFTLSNNQVYKLNGTVSFPIYLDRCVNSSTGPHSKIFNNMVSYDCGGNQSFAAYFDQTTFADIYHNTFNIYGGANINSSALYLTYSSFNNSKNNILNCNSGGSALQILNSNNNVYDFNSLYSNNVIVDNGVSFTLAGWQAQGNDLNSVSTNVTFVSNNDVHVVSDSLINNHGTPLPDVLTDIDNEVRSTTTPDIGADEFYVADSLVWPGDCNYDGITNNYDLPSIGLYFNQAGSPRSTITNMWAGQPSASWGSNQYNGSDKKHADSNGDGIINWSDTTAIKQNWGLTHPLRPVTHLYNGSLPDLHFVTNDTMVDIGDTVTVDLWMGDSVNIIPALYGISFDVAYPSSLVLPGSMTITYPSGFLGIENVSTITVSNIGATAAGSVVRITGTDTSGYGLFARLRFVIDPSVSSVSNLNLSFSNYFGFQSNGDSVLMNMTEDSITINPGVGFTENLQNNYFIIYPNPANNMLSIVTNEIQSSDLKILNTIGTQVYSSVIKTRYTNIPLNHFSNGVYYITLSSGKSCVTKKLLIMH